jgi:glutathione S-transferase
MSHTIYFAPEDRDPKLRDEGVEKLQKPLGVLNGVLDAGNGHVLGGRTTVVDINLMGILYQLRGHLEPLARFPKVDAWYGTMAARPAFRKVMAMREADQKK